MKWVQARKKKKYQTVLNASVAFVYSQRFHIFYFKILSRIVLFEKYFWKNNNWRVKQTLFVAAKDVSNSREREREKERERIAVNTFNDNFF